VFSFFRGYEFKELPEYDIDIIQPFLNFVEEIICDSNKDLYEYFINWFASIIKIPDCKLETAIQLIGEHGIGKNFLTNVLCKLLGRYAEENICDIEHVTGTFNDIIENKKLIVLNEISSVEDKYRNNNKLKSMTTEKTITINKKYVPIRKILNVSNFILASNHYICLVIEEGDRRFVVILVSDKRQQDTEYFEKLAKMLTPEFYSHLLTFFKKRDISNFNHRKIPMTAAKQNMIDASKSSYQLFVESCYNKIVDITGPELFKKYLNYCSANNFPQNTTSRTFIANIKKYTGEASSKRNGKNVTKVYNILPKTLEKLKSNFPIFHYEEDSKEVQENVDVVLDLKIPKLINDPKEDEYIA
jgi:phage/plasmid-associated DNA primase